MKRLAPPAAAKRWSGNAILFALLLFAATTVSYLPAIRGGFIWDDDTYVTENAALRTVEGLGRIWFEIGATPQYYPLTFTSYWMEYRLWGVLPLGYHLVNILLHAGSAILLWRLLRLLEVPGAWLAAAVFALHPVHVESVAWITERKNTLSVFLALSAAWMFVRFAGFGGQLKQPQGKWHYIAGLGLFVAALLAKTAICTLPAVLLAVLWWKRGRVSRNEWVATAPWFAASIASGLITAYVEKMHVVARGPDWELGAVERLLVASRAIWFYLGKLVWPGELIFVYPRWSVNASRVDQWFYPLGLGAFFLVLWWKRRAWARGPLAAMIIYCGSLLPALGLVNIYYMRFSYVADHFQYFPSIAMIALLSAILVTAANKTIRNPAAGAIALVVPVILAVLTWRQCGEYADQETLWRRTLVKNDRAWLAYANLGILAESRGEYAKAADLLRAALEIKSDEPHVRHGLAVVLARMDRREESIAEFKEALRLAPGYAKGRCGYGAALAMFGREEEAMAQLREVLRIDPKNVEAQYRLAGLLARRRDYAGAERYAGEAVRARPDLADAQISLANALAPQGKFDEAVEHYRRAVAIDVKAAEPANNLAWILATRPEVSADEAAEAVGLAERACAISRRQDAEHLDTLAAAYAAAGRFGDAVRTAQEATRLAESAKNPLPAGQMRMRLETYRKKLRWIER